MRVTIRFLVLVVGIHIILRFIFLFLLSCHSLVFQQFYHFCILKTKEQLNIFIIILNNISNIQAYMWMQPAVVTYRTVIYVYLKRSFKGVIQHGHYRKIHLQEYWSNGPHLCLWYEANARFKSISFCSQLFWAIDLSEWKSIVLIPGTLQVKSSLEVPAPGLHQCLSDGGTFGTDYGSVNRHI